MAVDPKFCSQNGRYRAQLPLYLHLHSPKYSNRGVTATGNLLHAKDRNPNFKPLGPRPLALNGRPCKAKHDQCTVEAILLPPESTQISALGKCCLSLRVLFCLGGDNIQVPRLSKEYWPDRAVDPVSKAVGTFSRCRI